MSLALQLKQQTTAIKFMKKVLGVRKRLNDVDRQRAAHPFQAQPLMLSASKKIIDTNDVDYRAVRGAIGRARSYWKSITVFYPVRGIRLIRTELVEQFETQMHKFEAELKTNLDLLCEHFIDLKQQASVQLGSLFVPGDYPNVDELRDSFGIDWEFPNVDPPNFLKDLNPKLYAQEQERVQARFDEAIAVAEQAMATELKSVMEGLVDRLAPSTGKKKALTQSAISGLGEFVKRFRAVSVSDDSELAQIVAQAEHLTQGLDPAALKKAPEQQGQLFTSMNALKESLDTLVMDAPTRKIQLEDDEE